MNRTMTVCAVALAALVAAGCGQPTAKQIMDKSAAAYKDAKTFTVKGENSFYVRTGGQWQSSGSNVTMMYEKPNKVRQETPNQPIMISNGKKSYIYHQQQKVYLEAPQEAVMRNLTGGQAAASLLEYMVNKAPFKGVKNAKALGSEKIGDVDTHVVQFTPGKKLEMPGLEKAKVTEKIWVGKQDWLVHKREITAEVPKEVMAEQAPPGTPADAATLTLSCSAKELKINGKIDQAKFGEPKGAKKMDMPQMPSAPPEQPKE